MNLTHDNYFDWKFYVREYPTLFLKTQDDAIEHWNNYGEQNNYLPNEYFKMYQDFNWKNYINNYDDIKHIDNKKDAFIHFINIGSKEKRSYKKKHNFKYIKEGKKLRALIKKINQGDIINRDDDEINEENDREKIIEKLYETFEINVELKNKIKNYEKDNSELKNEINILNDKLNLLNQNNNILLDDKNNLINKLNNLDDVNSNLSIDNNRLIKKNNLLNSQLSKLSNRNNILNNQLNEMMIKYNNQISNINNDDISESIDENKLCNCNNDIQIENQTLLKEKIDYLENIIINLKKDLNKEKQLNDKLFNKLHKR
jgi:hypothetical protein